MGRAVSGRLTPVQHWILGPSAVFADVNGFVVDRLDVKDDGWQEALEFLTGDAWGFRTPQDLLDQADLLIQYGHRADFAQTARMTTLPPAAREEFADLLRQMDTLLKQGAAGPDSAAPDSPETETLRQLVVLRFGASYAVLFDHLYGGDAQPSTEHPEPGRPDADRPSTGRPSTDHPSSDHPSTDLPGSGRPSADHSGSGHPNSDLPSADHSDADHPDGGQEPGSVFDDVFTTEMLKIRSFLNSVLTDPDYAEEEPRRLEMWLDPTFPREPSRYMIWDYARVMLLLRCGHTAGWLPEDFCWDRLFELAMDVQRHYESWQDMATCYLQGRLMWSGGMAGRQDMFEQSAKDLAADPDGPWNLVPWNLPLRRDWP